jgi:hypothetical protein
MTTHIPHLLIVGGASRNVGKTTFLRALICHFAATHRVVAVKIKTIRTGDSFFHGRDTHPLVGNFEITEETPDGTEDGPLMLQAGAQQVFRIKCHDWALAEAWQACTERMQQAEMIVCESNSLRLHISPGLFLLIKHRERPTNLKPSAHEVEHLASRIVWTDGTQHDLLPTSLIFTHGQWQLPALATEHELTPQNNPCNTKHHGDI